MSRKEKGSGDRERPGWVGRHEPGFRREREERPWVRLPVAPGDLEELEQRLESSLAAGPALEPFEPCVWFCACFLVHGS